MWLGPDEAGVHQFVLAVKRRMGSNLVQTLDHLEKNTQLFDRFALHKHPVFGRSKDSGMRESRMNVPIALLAIRHMNLRFDSLGHVGIVYDTVVAHRSPVSGNVRSTQAALTRVNKERIPVRTRYRHECLELGS